MFYLEPIHRLSDNVFEFSVERKGWISNRGRSRICIRELGPFIIFSNDARQRNTTTKRSQEMHRTHCNNSPRSRSGCGKRDKMLINRNSGIKYDMGTDTTRKTKRPQVGPGRIPKCGYLLCDRKFGKLRGSRRGCRSTVKIRRRLAVCRNNRRLCIFCG